jgi:hypothetical protein
MDCAAPLLEVAPMQTAAVMPRKKLRRERQCIGDMLDKELLNCRTARPSGFMEQESKHHKRCTFLLASDHVRKARVCSLKK